MRFGRIILAGLAPLVSLSALAAGFAASPHLHLSSNSARPAALADPLPRLLQAMVPLLVSPAGSAVLSLPSHIGAGPILALEGLWLLASLFAVNLFERRHQRVFLRC